MATVQFGLAWIAFDYHEGKPDVARTRSEQVTQSVSGLRAGIEDVHGRIGQLEEHVRSPKRMSLLSSATSAIAAATAAVVKQTTGKRVPVGQLRGIPISLPVAPFAIGAGALLLGGLDAMTQLRAEKELEERLGQLSGATGRGCQNVREAAPNLGKLQSLAEALAEPAT